MNMINFLFSLFSHFTSVQLIHKSLWIPIAFGKVNRNKSAAAKLAVTACENPKAVYTDVTLAVLKDLLKEVSFCV